MAKASALRLEPLGDQAVLVHSPDEPAALAFAAAVDHEKLPWAVDVVQAYATVAIYYRDAAVDFFAAKEQLTSLNWRRFLDSPPGNLHDVPCCYEFGMDFERISKHTGLTRDQIIGAHCALSYTVYAIGFCPGFPYLGYLAEESTGVARLQSPRLKVEAGSVGLTGRQTGIYTEERPGGWNIIGRTPLELVNVADGYFPIRTGDRVQFRRIDEREYRALAGERLFSDAH